MSTRRFGVIGAGRFGSALVEKLVANNAEAVLIDRSREKVQSFAESPAQAILGDACDIEVLREAGIQRCDTVVVAIGDNIESSVLITANCKALGVKTIVAKAKSELHGTILMRIGADYIAYPERDGGTRLAESLLNERSVSLYEIADGYSVAEVEAPAEMAGKSLIECGARQRYGVTVLAIRRLQPDTNVRMTRIAEGADIIAENDILVVFGPDRKLGELRG